MKLQVAISFLFTVFSLNGALERAATFDGHDYRFFYDTVAYGTAKSNCEKHQMVLLSIETVEEADFIAGELTNRASFLFHYWWVNLQEWTSGENVTKMWHWGSYYGACIDSSHAIWCLPDGNYEDGNCVVYNNHPKYCLQHMDCDSSYGYVCEEPAKPEDRRDTSPCASRQKRDEEPEEAIDETDDEEEIEDETSDDAQAEPGEPEGNGDSALVGGEEENQKEDDDPCPRCCDPTPHKCCPLHYEPTTPDPCPDDCEPIPLDPCQEYCDYSTQRCCEHDPPCTWSHPDCHVCERVLEEVREQLIAVFNSVFDIYLNNDRK